MLYDVGTICIKIAGRDAGKTCVVVEVIDDSYVLVDGQTRRRKCNVVHLEPLRKKVNIKKGADSKTVDAALAKLGLSVKKTTPKKTEERPKKACKTKKKQPEKKSAKTTQKA